MPCLQTHRLLALAPPGDAGPSAACRRNRWIRRGVPARLGDVGRHAQRTGAQPAGYCVAPALMQEPPGEVERLLPDVAAATQQLVPGSARAQDFNMFAMHALASDPRALRMLLHASGHNLETPVSRIVHDGWRNLAPIVQQYIALEVLAPAWLARTAPDFSDPRMWAAGQPG